MSAAAPLLCTLVPGGAGAPLYLVPSVGTTPMSLVRLARSIAPRRPVHAFAYAGLDDDAPTHATLEAMATACVGELVAAAPHGPYLIGGHCLGGAVAHAIAHELEARGATVARLAVLDSIAPLAAGAEGAVGKVDQGNVDHLRRVIVEIVERTVVHSSALAPAMFRRLSDVLKRHIEAGVAYRARPIRAGVSILRTEGCSDALLEGWARTATGRLCRHDVPGDTLSMLKPPHVDAVGRILGCALEEDGR